MNHIGNPHFDSRDLALLQPAFREKVEAVLAACLKRGVKMTPFFTLRGPGVQARLWCQSRTMAQIQEETRRLTRAGAPWLASLLRVDMGTDSQKRDSALPRRWATNALPGQSWHQWGEAVDCFVQDSKGAAVWDSNHFGYEVYAEEAERAGLTAGANWKNRDAVHVQQSKNGVLTVMELRNVEARMVEIWKARKEA